MAVQVLKLGLAGAEQTLVEESRINNGGQDEFNYISGQSANGSLKVDVIATKRNFNISWGVMSETNYTALKAIYALQLTGVYLSYIFTDEIGAETTVTVFMQPPSKGELIQRETYYSNAVTIQLQEV
jgi:hypothetical protein